ncbi:MULTISPECIES: hypothetical protein [unclassified Sulfitobacter]|uniref:hypothetical protein n=1 Tax=unclassified Sulfitobacter TaxID=196795 RepID=UPI00374682C9
MPKSSRTLIAVLALLLSIAFAISPFFVPSFSGFDPNQFPIPQDNPPAQPAGYAFSIWGVIYLWLIAGLGYGLLRAPRDGQWHDMRVPLCLSLAVGTTWLAVATMSPVWAAILIWIMLITALIALFLAPVEDPLWAAAPVGLYAGWLSAASCVSLALLAAGYGYLEEQTAAVVFVGLAIAIGAIVQTALGRTPTYGIAVIWGLVGVVVTNWGEAPLVAYLALGGSVIVALPTVRAFRRG